VGEVRRAGDRVAAVDDVDLRMDAVVEVPVAALDRAAPYYEGAEDRLLSRDEAALALDVLGDELDRLLVLLEVRGDDPDGDAVLGEAEEPPDVPGAYPRAADADALLSPEELALDEGTGVAAYLDPQLGHL